MATDYNLPHWFFDPDVTDEDRHVWMTQDRCLRQAMRQDTPYGRRVKKIRERMARRSKARSDTVDLEDYR